MSDPAQPDGEGFIQADPEFERFLAEEEQIEAETAGSTPDGGITDGYGQETPWEQILSQAAENPFGGEADQEDFMAKLQEQMLADAGLLDRLLIKASMLAERLEKRFEEMDELTRWRVRATVYFAAAVGASGSASRLDRWLKNERGWGFFRRLPTTVVLTAYIYHQTWQFLELLDTYPSHVAAAKQAGDMPMTAP